MTSGAGRGFIGALAIVLCAYAAPAGATPAAGSRAPARAWMDGRGHYMHRGSNGVVDVNVCSADQQAGFARCDAHIRTDLFASDVQPSSSSPGAPGATAPHDVIGNQGAYDPVFLQSAYNAPSSTHGDGQTVAVVDAFDAPNVEADLAVYRTRFGLPACT